MVVNRQTFTISYRSLLAVVADELGWAKPVYNQLDTISNSACVLIKRCKGPVAYSFSGDPKNTLAESEEEAAEKAVDYLVQKKKIIVDDVNLDRRQMHKACMKFYQEKKALLECLGGASTKVPALYRGTSNEQGKVIGPRIVSIEFWGLLLQIVGKFKLNCTEVEDMVLANGEHVCSLMIKWHGKSSRMGNFIGECCITLDGARQSLAKKVINYLQNIYGFTVKDVNYYRMVCTELDCGVQREHYLAVKDKVAKELWPMALHSEEDCRTPEGPEFEIQAGLSLPPPPKKPKTVWMAAASSSTTNNITILGSGVAAPEQAEF